MKRFTIFLLLCVTCIIPAYGYNLEHIIQNQLKKANLNADIGIKIRNLKTGKILFEQNPDRYYIFASALKFMTIAVLKEYYGPNKIFLTKILKKNNDYYLDINDPDFSTKDLDDLVKAIKETTGSHITGNFYVIKDNFSLPNISEGKMEEDSNYCYGSPISKVHINKNCVRFYAQAKGKIGAKIRIEDQGLVPYKVLNIAKIIPNKDQDRIKSYIQEGKLVIDGTLNKLTGKVTIGTVVHDNFAHVKLMLAKLLRKNNVTIAGEISYSSMPTDAIEVIQNKKDFYQIACKALKNSDNYLTDYLLADFANIYAKENWRQAGSMIKRMLTERFEVNLSDAVIVDGSGISRHNMLTVNQFDHFLTSVYKSNDWQQIFPMLAEPGQKGTLEERLQGLKVYAKTGGMSGVSSLVGYVLDKNNTPYSFVMVSNNYIGHKKIYTKLEDSIVRMISEK